MATWLTMIRRLGFEACGALLALGGVWDASFALAQEAPPSGADAPLPASASAPVGTARDDEDPLAVFRAPLLREGSHLVEVKARLVRDPEIGWWQALIEPETEGGQRYELTLLPCTRLTEMQRILQVTPNARVTFEITGQVFVFRGVNYLLPTHAPVLVDQHMNVEASAPISAGPATAPAATQPARDSAEDIARELQQATGPLTRSAVSPQGGATQDQTRASGADGAPGSGASNQPMAENASIVTRRGKVMRDRNGGWTFVFDADAAGLADPPMKLMPCLMLERIEDHARRVGNNAPVLLSGQVYVYGGQNHLLPTMFRIPREQTKIVP